MSSYGRIAYEAFHAHHGGDYGDWDEDSERTAEIRENWDAAGWAVAEIGDRIIRDILEAMCRKNCISLESKADPGTSARNYELADRLGISSAFGLEAPGDG